MRNTVFVFVLFSIILSSLPLGSRASERACCKYDLSTDYNTCDADTSCSSVERLYESQHEVCNECPETYGTILPCRISSYLRCYVPNAMEMTILDGSNHPMSPLQTWSWTRKECQQHDPFVPLATTTGNISCTATCNGAACLSEVSETERNCPTCEGCRIQQSPVCIGYAQGWSNGAGPDYEFTPPSCPIPTSVNLADTCGYAWSFSKDSIETKPVACPTGDRCGKCPDIPLCLKIITTNGLSETTYKVVEKSHCKDAPPTYLDNDCTYEWSTTSSTFTAAQGTIMACPPANYSTCGGTCSLSSEITCWALVNGSPINKSADCPSATKPKYTTSCTNRWSSSKTSYIAPPTPTSVCPTKNSCGACSDNSNVGCVSTKAGTDTFVAALIDTQCAATKPKYADNTCTYHWSKTSSSYTAAQASMVCPAGNYSECGGACSLSSEITCWAFLDGSPLAISDAGSCTSTKPTYRAECESRWSASSTSYASPPASTAIACPNATACGTCPNNANVKCITVKRGTTAFVAVVGDADCAGTKPTYAPNVCTYQWSKTSGVYTAAQTTMTCPAANYSTCGGVCSLSSALTCWLFRNESAVGAATETSCGPKPTYTTFCDKKWSASPTTYSAPPATSSVACPTPTTCGACVDNSRIRCISTKAGTNTFVAEIVENECASPKPVYASVTCDYRCRDADSPVLCPPDGSQTCSCTDPTCTFTAEMECYNQVTSTFVTTGCSGNAVHPYSGASPTNCNNRWSYSASAPWDFSGSCPDPKCSQSCQVTLPVDDVKCVTSADAGSTWEVTDDSFCSGAKPTSYVPFASCSWVCTPSPIDNIEIPCNSSVVAPCTKCNAATSVSYTRTKCKNKANNQIDDPVGGWCGGTSATISIPRTCPSCSWLCADPQNAALSIPCASITVSNYPTLPALQCADCAACDKTVESQCWSSAGSGAFITDIAQCTFTQSQPDTYITPGNPHSCSWQWVLDDKSTKTTPADPRFKQLCPLTDCKTCDQTISQSCWDDTRNAYVADPTNQCSGAGSSTLIQGTANCPGPCTTCGWGCLSSSGAYKPRTDPEFTKQCPTPGDISCTCAIQRTVKCVDYQSSVHTSTTTLAANLNACDGQAEPDSIFVYDRQRRCDLCWDTKPYWTGIDCSVEPKIDNFSLSAGSSFNVSTLQEGQELSYNDSLHFTWDYSGLETNIATITMTSSSIAPLKSITIASFRANTNAFTLKVSTLPFNTKLENVQFYLTIGGNVVRTQNLPIGDGYIVTARCVSNICQHNSVCNETTGVCDCDSSTIWTRGIFCEQSVCSALDCVASNVTVDDSTGDICGYKAEFEGQTNPPLQCNCKSDEITGLRCQNECSTADSCPTDTGRAALTYIDSPTNPDAKECSCDCLGQFSGSNCSRCGLECANGGRSNTRCQKCTCPFAGNNSYFWFGKTCNCRAFALKLTLNVISPELYAVLESGHELFAEAVANVLDESNQSDAISDDRAIVTDDDRAIFDLTANGQMKAFMTSLLISLLTDHYDTLIRMNALNDSDLFVTDEHGQSVLNADSITKAVSIRSIAFTISPQSVAITMVIVPNVCHQPDDTSPINNDAWDTTSAVVNYMNSMLGKDNYTVNLEDPECFGTVCQAKPTSIDTPAPELESLAAVALPSLCALIISSLILFIV